MYGTERMVERMAELINGVWRGEGFPVDCHIYKKGEKNRAENYRGITLLNTWFKLYASVLSERMKREIEDRGKRSGTEQPSRVQKRKGHYGQCVHPGPFSKK
jgi:hypothetical protein